MSPFETTTILLSLLKRKQYEKNLNVPGQGMFWHSVSSNDLPSQGEPPWNGPMQFLIRFFNPGPHSEEHGLKADHSDHEPFTVKYWKRNSWFTEQKNLSQKLPFLTF